MRGLLCLLDRLHASNDEFQESQCAMPHGILPLDTRDEFFVQSLVFLNLKMLQSTTQVTRTGCFPRLWTAGSYSPLQGRKTASLMKYQEEFRESSCELLKEQLEQHSSTQTRVFFSDERSFLHVSTQEFTFIFILNVKINRDIVIFLLLLLFIYF